MSDVTWADTHVYGYSLCDKDDQPVLQVIAGPGDRTVEFHSIASTTHLSPANARELARNLIAAADHAEDGAA